MIYQRNCYQQSLECIYYLSNSLQLILNICKYMQWSATNQCLLNLLEFSKKYYQKIYFIPKYFKTNFKSKSPCQDFGNANYTLKIR